jgi:serine/threonine-protein kinase
LSTGSDVYSLGVVLYLLLCGENPYEIQRESAAFLEQAIQEIDPRAPSRRALAENTALLRSCTSHSLRIELANDLDAIVLKALHKQADQRYGSAEAFHADLQRWLDGKAVLAKPPSKIYYASKFVLRNRWAVGLGTSAVVALITLTVLATLFGVQASRQSARASASRDFLIDMFRQADPELTGGREISAKDLLITAKGTLMAKLPGQPLLQGELLHGLGMAQSNMSEYLQADQTMASAAQIYQRLDKQSDAAVVSIDQAEAVYSAGDYARAKALLAQASQLRALRDLPAASQATFHTVTATLELSTGDIAKARSEVQMAVQLNTQAYGLNHSKTVRTLVLQGRVQTQAGDFDGARQSLNQAKEQVDQSPQLEPSDLGNLLGAQAQLELALGQAAKAEALFDRAATRCEQLFNPMGEECVVLRNRQVGTLLAMGQTDKAQKYLPSLQSQIQNSGSPRRQAEALLSASRLIARSRLQGEYPAIWSQLVALSESGPEIKATEVNKLWALSIRSESALQNGNPKVALQMLERVEKRIESKSLAMQNLAANVHGLMGVASALQGPLAAAHPFFEQAIGELQRANANVAAVQLMRARQAVALAAEGKLAPAKAQLNTAYEILRNAYGSTSPVVIKLEAKLQALANLQNNTLSAPLAADYFL